MARLFSASKIVFIILTLTAAYAFIKGVLPVDQFMLLTMAAYSFYFTKSIPDTNGETTVTKLETSTTVKPLESPLTME